MSEKPLRTHTVVEFSKKAVVHTQRKPWSGQHHKQGAAASLTGLTAVSQSTRPVVNHYSRLAAATIYHRILKLRILLTPSERLPPQGDRMETPTRAIVWERSCRASCGFPKRHLTTRCFLLFGCERDQARAKTIAVIRPTTLLPNTHAYAWESAIPARDHRRRIIPPP